METTISNKKSANFIDGSYIFPDRSTLDVISPLDGSKISEIPESATSDLDEAVKAAKKAYPAWSGLTLKERVQFFFKYRLYNRP